MEFVTIEKLVQAEVTEKKSKFIANLFPVQNAEEAEETIKMIKKKYHDARHNCMAYRVAILGGQGSDGGRLYLRG